MRSIYGFWQRSKIVLGDLLTERNIFSGLDCDDDNAASINCVAQTISNTSNESLAVCMQ